jgi:prolyl-tRNA editing enzyme YbaK/EbsC (Cys-tRNA(Pro) deacylase)
MRILADEAIFEEEEISIGSGVRGTTVILRSADLKNSIAGLEVGVFANAT